MVTPLSRKRKHVHVFKIDYVKITVYLVSRRLPSMGIGMSGYDEKD